MKTAVWAFAFFLFVNGAAAQMIYAGGKELNTQAPDLLKNYISKIDLGLLGSNEPVVQWEKVSNTLVHVYVSWNIKDTIHQDDWKLVIHPSFKPGFNWAPHLTPTDDHIIAQHVFRSPALIAANSQKQISIIPDLDLLHKGSPVEWYMDMNAITNELILGMSRNTVKEHTLFIRKSGAVYPPGKIEFGFFIAVSHDNADLLNPFRKLDSFFWNKWGASLYAADQPLEHKDLEPYARYTYDWAFGTWKKSVWQDITLQGKPVGGTVFIVNVTQSPDYPGKVNEREFRSVWNQAWFSSLRSAGGLYRYARRTSNKELLEYANKTKELALSFPQRNGFFDAVIATEMEEVEMDGKKYSRSKGWDHYYFGNSNRNPYSFDAKESPLHVLDMSFTGFLMLQWYQELEKDKRLIQYATAYANALLGMQDKKGYFPAWIDAKTLKPLPVLNQSPETSMSVTFLLKLYALTKNEKYKTAALRAMQAVMQVNIGIGQWEDFETYWSCSRYGSKELVGKKVERNNMFKQNNFSIYWTAEALLNCYETTKEKRYLQYGQRTLDELLMTQAIWQPPYMYVNVFGGFGVMNGDGEWLDARQSIFAELMIRYGKLLKREEYIQRGLAALRASFVMMYCPENARTKKQWEERWPFFGPADYGFMMENYGHGGITSSVGEGIGEFTIYDWGNGAASEAYNRIRDHFGKDFLDKN